MCDGRMRSAHENAAGNGSAGVVVAAIGCGVARETWAAADDTRHEGVPMTANQRSDYEEVGLRAVRPYLIVDDADAAIDFYQRAFDAIELERHHTPSGGIGHAKVRISDTIIELGEHPDASNRAHEQTPRIGLRLYVTDTDRTYAAAIAAGANGDPPSNRLPGTRSATVHDPFGLTWWLATTLE
jgi:PhnB protein